MGTDNLREALAAIEADWRHQIDHQLKPDAAEQMLRYCHKKLTDALAAHPAPSLAGQRELLAELLRGHQRSYGHYRFDDEVTP